LEKPKITKMITHWFPLALFCGLGHCGAGLASNVACATAMADLLKASELLEEAERAADVYQAIIRSSEQTRWARSPFDELGAWMDRCISC
jgi:hypothetical protein